MSYENSIRTMSAADLHTIDAQHWAKTSGHSVDQILAWRDSRLNELEEIDRLRDRVEVTPDD